MGKAALGLTIKDGRSITANSRGSQGVVSDSDVSGGFRGSTLSAHTAGTIGSGKRGKNQSKEAKKTKGPTLAKAFFPEKQNCTCCHGYIYGCDETVCHELGKCICSLEEGEGTGEVKEKKGKYEFLEVHHIKRAEVETSRISDFKMRFAESEESKLSLLIEMLGCPKRIPRMDEVRAVRVACTSHFPR